MKRAERTEFTDLKNKLRKGFFGPNAILTIATGAGTEFKNAAHELFRSNGFHPCSIQTDAHRFDEQERILYIRDTDGTDWMELYSDAEKDAFKTALNS